ncbi:MAG: cadmium-translocating P-type ATPase [Rhodobacteraceae bacterium]|nr:cadmium-translocating P-type ATPase [Paracoccaceae bacterium]
MSASEALPRPQVCPACAIPQPEFHLPEAASPGQIVLSLPGVHCAACISTVENRLAREPGIRSARVNLSLKRVAVDAGPGITADHLVGVLAGVGYEAHELDPALLAETGGDKTGRDLLMRLAVSGFAMMNVMLLSVAVWSGAEDATRDMMHWISAMIALPVIVFAGQPFYRNAWSALKVGRLNMDVPISLAILLAGAMSLYETMMSGHHAYFDAALSLTFFLLGGRYLDYRTRASARSAAQELAALEVPRALRLVDGAEVLTPVATLGIGDHVVVRPGTRLPVDGEVISGESEIDRAFLTGESLPAYAGPGSRLNAGEINLTGQMVLSVTALSKDSSLRKMADLVALAETARNRYTSLADRAAAIYAPGVHLLAAIAFVVWVSISGDIRLSLNIAIAVLIITCPCALGLAVPAVTTMASGRLYRKGALLKSSTALERLAEADTIVFDKTGTLTLGVPKLDPLDDAAARHLDIAATLATHSSHPLARALVAGAGPFALADISDIREVPGYGMEGVLNGAPVRLGRASWVGADAPAKTATCLKIGDAAPVSFTFTDELRPGVDALIAAAARLGLETHLITGDTEAAAGDIAARVGIANVTASALPGDKVDYVSRLAAEGRRVLMIGDGLNDTGALAAAHVSISPASAIDAARVASDIVVLGRDFAVIGDAIVTARSARTRIKENFAIAAIYNMIAVPFALLGFATPLMAALAMSTSSITVTLNAFRVR